MILLIGFPKSGTSSFQQLFTECGYKTVHWKYGNKYIGTIIKNNKKNNRPLLTGFEKIDGITQMDVCISPEDCYWPQIVDYKQLYYENRDAVIILNKRNPTELLNSFKNWKSYDERLYKYNPELITDKSDKGFIQFVQNHYNAIEQFFASLPTAKFISYDINQDTIDKLTKYIDLKGKTSLPKINVNIKKN